MKKYLLLPILLLLVFAPVIHAQSFMFPGQSMDIPFEGYGISFGNSKNFTGLRFNVIDSEVEKINGLNFIVGFPFRQEVRTVSGAYNGLTLGIAGNGAKRVNGIMIGTLGTFVDDEITGILITAVHNTTEMRHGRMHEHSLGGRVTNKITGLAICGGGCVAQNLNGIIFSGFWPTAEKMNGIALGGLMVLADSPSQDDGSVTGGEINGIAIGGIATVTDRMNGISIGLVNYAKELNGIQIGLVNIAKNNPAWSQILPGINAHFSF